MRDPAIAALIAQVSEDRIRETLRYLCKDPLPYRKLNYTLPGHDKCTLYEADDYIVAQLEACNGPQAKACGYNGKAAGYTIEREAIPAQASLAAILTVDQR